MAAALLCSMYTCASAAYAAPSAGTPASPMAPHTAPAPSRSPCLACARSSALQSFALGCDPGSALGQTDAGGSSAGGAIHKKMRAKLLFRAGGLNQHDRTSACSFCFLA